MYGQGGRQPHGGAVTGSLVVVLVVLVVLRLRLLLLVLCQTHLVAAAWRR
jgi:hypothetical protein